MKNRTLCIGDIHGGYLALLQCLERSKFDYDNDTMICLGDVVDGWPETPQCIEELLKIKKLIYVMGNHDTWCNDWFKNGNKPPIWTSQGGQATIDAYEKHPLLKDKHKDFFDRSVNCHIDDRNNIYVHGGFDPFSPFPAEEQHPEDLQWNRTLYQSALSWKPPTYKDYNEVYIGHSSTSRVSKVPLKRGNLWMLDQGGGYEGKLSIIDVDTHEFWQSDRVDTLYPNHRGR